jgi:hypothetical protein
MSNSLSGMSLQPHASLLGLPKHIRARILRETGLLREYPITIFTVPNSIQKSFARVYKPQERSLPTSPQPIYQLFPFQLFLVCLRLFTETLEVFYAENKFCINYGDHELVMKLQEFRPEIWANMQNLIVHFNLERASSRSWKSVTRASTFECLCQILSNRLKPYQTTMSFLFDALTSGEASLLLAYASHLPRLANVRFHITASLDGVSLRRERDLLIHWSADVKTVLGSISRKLTQKPYRQFPFLRLPMELQLMVLSHAGLVVPFKKGGGVLLCAKLFASGECCGHCQVTQDAHYKPNPMCWCNRDLYYSSTCTCHQHLNHGLFATSKTIRQQALEIAFSENEFLITHRPWKSIEHTAETFSQIPSTRLQWIKHLTVDFEALHLGQNSSQLIRFLLVVHRLCAPRKLSLKLRFLHPFSFNAEELKLLYATISELAFGKIVIQLPNFERCLVGGFTGLRFHVSSPPRDSEMVTVLGDGVERDVDEVVAELMEHEWSSY